MNMFNNAGTRPDVVVAAPNPVRQSNHSAAEALANIAKAIDTALSRIDRLMATRVAQRRLSELDDHLLKDLGIDRSDIRQVVRSGALQMHTDHDRPPR